MSEIVTELANCVESKGLSNEPETISSGEVAQSQESTDNELKENTKADKGEEIETETNTEEKQVNQLDTKCIDENKSEHVKEYAENVKYEADGSAVYTDPETKFQYKWCTETNSWLAEGTANNPYENEYYRWCRETQKWLPKQEFITETEHYKWDAEKREWLLKYNLNSKDKNEIKFSIDEQGQRICTDQDGTVYVWDAAKNAWFPKIDDNFMAIYQMNYGFNNDTTDSKESEKNEQNEKARAEALKKEQELKRLSEEATEREQGAKRKLQEPPKWFDIDTAHNTKVYVSNLPLDITLEEFTELMSKCGLIMRDPQTQKYKIKLYTEPDGQVKGDGLCDYIKVESVDLALNILDEYNLRGHKIRVQRAKFQMRGEYNPALKPKRKKKDKEKLAKIKEKLFDWRPEKMRGERSKHEKIVIIKNLFQPDLFEKEVQLILEYQNDLREECSKCGQVRKVIIYDRHTEGVAQINMSTAEEADLVIQMMQGRFFGKRQLTAEHWDGKTKYKIEESETEAQKRLNKWDEFLETEESKDSSKTEENPTEVEKSAVDAKIEEDHKEEKDITPAAESVQTCEEN